jgi:hypothetical protein
MKTVNDEVVDLKKANNDHVVRATQKMMRSLGGIVGVSCGLAKDTGKFITTGSKIMANGSTKILARLSETVKKTSNTIAGLSLRHTTAAKDSPDTAIEEPELVKNGNFDTISETAIPEPDTGQTSVRPKAMKALVTALESKIAAARRRLAEEQIQAEKTRSQLTSQIKSLQVEKKSLISELAEVRNKRSRSKKTSTEFAGPTKKVKPRKNSIKESPIILKSEPDTLEPTPDKQDIAETDFEDKSSPDSGIAQVRAETMLSDEDQNKVAVATIDETTTTLSEQAAETEEKTDAKPEDNQIQQPDAEAQGQKPVSVTLQDVETSDFSNEGDKIIFKQALSDIADKDTSVRIDAVRTIAGIYHQLSVRLLSAQMASEPLSKVRQECIKALIALQMTEGLPAVKQALEDESVSVRLAAVWGLYHLDGEQSAPELIRMLSDENEDVRRRAVTCIGWLGKAELTLELSPLLSDSSVLVRRSVVEAMANLRCRKVVPELIECLNDPAESVRKAVLDALKTITSKQMSGPFPKNKKSVQHLIARWRDWWKQQCAEQNNVRKKNN